MYKLVLNVQCGLCVVWSVCRHGCRQFVDGGTLRAGPPASVGFNSCEDVKSKKKEPIGNSALIDLSLCCLNTYLKYVALFDQSCNHSNKSLHSCRDKLSICCFSPTTTSSGQDILNRQMHDMMDWAVFKLFNTVANALSTGTM